MPFEYNMLPTISTESVMSEAKRILLEEAHVQGVDIILRVLNETPFEWALPELTRQVAQLTDYESDQIKDLQNRVAAWRRNLAVEALSVLTDDQRATIVRSLQERFENSGQPNLDAKMASIIRNALSLAGEGRADDGQPRVKLIPSSALGVLEDVESYTKMGFAYQTGDPHHVPVAMTIYEIVEHCADTMGASEPEKAWAVRRLAEFVTGEDIDEQSNPRYWLERFTHSSGIGHEKWIKILQDILQELQR